MKTTSTFADKVKPLVYHSTGITELDKVIGGGLVYGKTLLLGAPRGAGRTTLLMQACHGFSKGGKKAFFGSGEMQTKSIVDYANRLGVSSKDVGVLGSDMYIDVDDLINAAHAFGAQFIALDNIQNTEIGGVKGDIGSLSMTDAVVEKLVLVARQSNVSVVAVANLCKNGDFAGSEKMQNRVDGLLRLDVKYVVQVEGDSAKDVGVREISMDGKNRQGRSDVTALVEMTNKGFRPMSAKAYKTLSRNV